MDSTIRKASMQHPQPPDPSSRRRSVAAFAGVAWRDLTRRRRPVASEERHLLAAEAWLRRAQDVAGDGGVSYGYTLRDGWRPSYPETSGYITTTFLRLARDRDASYTARAGRILQWLMRIQSADGSFSNPRYGPDGIVFDTGQILFGLVRGYELTGDPRMLDSAVRASTWLTRIADADLRWTRNEHLGTPHVYNTRTAWALLRMNQVVFDAGREAVARSNLDWALAMQRSNGLFDHCAFRAAEAPYTHTIAYAARGLLESGALLGRSDYVDAADRCAHALLGHMRDDGSLPSTITADGHAASRSSCLTGNCQFALVWGRLSALNGGAALVAAMGRTLDFVMSTQDLTTTNPDIRGGIKGSDPVWGRYACMSYPNWATKFFVDAMWLRRSLSR